MDILLKKDYNIISIKMQYIFFVKIEIIDSVIDHLISGGKKYDKEYKKSESEQLRRRKLP